MFKSGIILKDRVFVPDYDHHTDMLEELGIEDNWTNAETKFIRVELIPPNNDMFSPIETWKFNVDQDILPDWYVKEVDRDRMVSAVKGWAKEHIFIDKSDFTIGEGTYYLKNCKRVACHSSTVKAYDSSTVEAYDSSTVKAYDSSTVKAYDSSTVKACHSSTVKAYDSSTVKAYDSSTVEAYDSSTVEAWGSSTVEAWGSSTVEAWGSSTVEAWGSAIAFIPKGSMVKRESIVLMENSTLKDCNTKTLYQSGDWKLVIIDD